MKTIENGVMLMKIKIKKKSYEDVLSLPIKKRQKPVRQSRLLKLLVAILSFRILKLRVYFEMIKCL